jgi:hypothetical protein
VNGFQIFGQTATTRRDPQDTIAHHIRKKNSIFADIPKQGQVSVWDLSVWDFLRPPELVRDEREIVVRWGTTLVARTRGAWAVRETSHPPGFYLPLENVKKVFLYSAGRGSFCE